MISLYLLPFLDSVFINTAISFPLTDISFLQYFDIIFDHVFEDFSFLSLSWLFLFWILFKLFQGKLFGYSVFYRDILSRICAISNIHLFLDLLKLSCSFFNLVIAENVLFSHIVNVFFVLDF